MTRTRRALLSAALSAALPATVALAAFLSAVTPAARAQDAPPETFLLTGKFQLKIADKPVPDAKVYAVAAGAPKLLVLGGGDKPVLITAGGKTVEPIDPARVAPGDGDAVTVAPGAAAGPVAALVVDGARLKANLGGAQWVLEPRAALAGDMEPEKLLAYMPEYRRNYDAYKPRLGDMRLLETLQQPTEIDIFFGTWCPHCEKYVPRMLRVAKELKNPNLTFKLHGVPANIDDDPLARQLKIKAIPMGLIKRGDQLVATVEGNNWERPESTLTALLFGDPS